MNALVSVDSGADDASEQVALQGGANDVIARRAGRIAFGLVLIAGVFALGAFVIHDGGRNRWPIHAWHIVAGTWLAALFGAKFVTGIVGSAARYRNNDHLRRPALSVPAVGIALMLPITLHMPFVLTESVRMFDEWLLLSAFFAGHTHIVFALFVLARAQALTSDRAGRKVPSISVIYIITVIAAAIPFVIPALFVALTGLPFVILLRRMESIARRDREDSRDVPFAIVRSL